MSPAAARVQALEVKRTMQSRSITIAAVCTFAAISAYGQVAEEQRSARVQTAVRAIVDIQLTDGEMAAIDAIQACYQAIPPGQVTEKLEDCVAKDIAYANLSAGMYRNVLKNVEQPEYPTMAALGKRVYAQAMRAGLSRKDADTFLRSLAPMAIQALASAMQPRKP